MPARRPAHRAGNTRPDGRTRAAGARDGRRGAAGTAVETAAETVLAETAVLTAAMPAATDPAGPGAATAAPKAPRWRVRAIRAGLSANGNFYADAVLRAAVPLFDGARVLARSDEDHLADTARDVRNIVGRLAAPVFVEDADSSGECGAIEADLEPMEPEGAVARLLREARARGMLDLMGLSIVARGRARPGEIDGRAATVVDRIDRVDSVDLVVEPAAGGALIDLVEAVRRPPALGPDTRSDTHTETDEGDDAMRNRMTAFIKARLGAARLEGLADGDDAALEALYREAAGADGNTGADNAAPEAPPEAPLTPAELDRRIAAAGALAEARAGARARLAESGLPEAARTRLAARFAGAEAGGLAAAAVDAAVAAERAYLAEAAPGGQVAGLGAAGAARVGESRGDKVRRMWDSLLDPADGACVSLRAAYVETTGDERVTGLLRECDGARLREAVTASSVPEILGDSIARRMIADYRETGIHDGWMRWCSATVAMDFRAQRRVRWGGYANLAAVNEGADYAAMSTPADEEETYTVSKRGGTESVTLEAIRNDDVAAIQRLPAMLARAAKRTLSAFAASFLTANATLADGRALFHANHKNLGSAALSATSLAAARLAMVKQAELTSGKALGIGPRSLLVPFDLEETAANLFRRSTENDRTFTQSLALDVVPVPELADANDWYLAADPMDIPTVEIGFLDGRREPELFVQDSPTLGSLFSADKITWKIRHVYGGAVLDHRGLYKAAVS